LADAQSGIGTVHNTYMLEGEQKTVLEGPIVLAPKPFWFPTHRRPEPIAWKVLALYGHPSVWKLPGLALSALGG
jgi:aldehyde dehydrogenase (NAD(P)+)